MSSLPVIRTRYQKQTSPGVCFADAPSMTKQSFAAEADINTITRRYIQTGVLPSGDRKPSYGDFSSSADYLSLQNRLAVARQDFEALPSDLRADFGNKVENLLEYISDPANREEAIELGLLPAGAPASSEQPLLDVTVPTDTDVEKPAVSSQQERGTGD